MPLGCLSIFKDKSNNVFPFSNHFFSCPIIFYTFSGKNLEKFWNKHKYRVEKSHLERRCSIWRRQNINIQAIQDWLLTVKKESPLFFNFTAFPFSNLAKAQEFAMNYRKYCYFLLIWNLKKELNSFTHQQIFTQHSHVLGGKEHKGEWFRHDPFPL